MKVTRGRITFWGLATLLVALIVWAFRPQPIPVDLSTVSRGSLRVTVDEEGVTRVRERYVVSAPVAGRMQRLELEPGDKVVARQTVLATFMPATPTPLDPRARAEAEARLKAAQASREQAQLAVQRAQNELSHSQNELARYRELEKFGGTTEEHVAALELDARTKQVLVNAAQHALKAAESEVDAVRAVLRQFTNPPSPGNAGALTLRSPVDGTVLRVHQESETLVPAGTPLIDIGNPAEIEIVADLLSTDAVKVKPGYPVLIEGWGGDGTLHGRVQLVEPAGFTKISALGVEEQRVNVLIAFDGPQGSAPRLGDGYRVEVSVIIWERANVLKAPTSALFRVGDAWAAFAVRDGRAVQTPIEIGQRNAIEAEVVSGLNEGDRVIVHPGDTIADGVAVVPR